VRFSSDPVPRPILDEIITAATVRRPERFAEPPWRFVVVVGDERERLVSRVAEALGRHWGLGPVAVPPRGLALDAVLNAPALVLVFSKVPATEGVEGVALVAGVAQEIMLLCRARGLGIYRTFSPNLVPEAVLEFAAEHLGPAIRGAELVTLLAVGYAEQLAAPPRDPGVQATWIGAPGEPPAFDPQESEPVRRPAAVLSSTRGERVLVVDPYQYNRDLLQRHLQAAGYAVSVCPDGAALLAAAEQQAPDLYIINDALPDTTGFELARRLLARGGQTVPILLTTTRPDSGFRIGGLAAGVDYYLRRPVNPVELFTAVRILLDRHRLVEELHRATAFREALLAAMENVGIIAMSDRFEILYASPGAVHLFGYPEEEMLGRTPAFMAADGRLPAPLDAAAGAGDPDAHVSDVRLRRRDGTVFDAEMMRYATRDPDGTVGGYLGVMFDISARKEMERQLAAKNRELSEQSDQLGRANEDLTRLLGELRAAQTRLVQQAKMASIGELVAGVAHEINTPLGAVVSNNDLFFRILDRLSRRMNDVWDAGLLPAEERLRGDLVAAESLTAVTRTACQRIVDIVRTLRTFARPDQGEATLVDLHEGLDSTLVLVGHLLKKGIAVERRYGPVPKVAGHANQLNQVFMNLLVNAAQAIEREGAIRICTALDGTRVRVGISDTGVGIPADHLPRIFDPGFTTKGVGLGTGLGLSICYQIVEAHGGEITVESAVGRGTTFTVTLPVSRAARAAG
jgi:PAS domain S-box-containing protein